MASPSAATIPDELLEEIFLHLPTPDELARAAAACTSFRRVIKGRAFRRRFLALHRSPLLGFMDAAGFYPAEAPHPSAPLASVLAPNAGDFSFLPAVVSSSPQLGFQDDGEGPRWRPRDVRDGRVLLDWISLHPRGTYLNILMDYSEISKKRRDYMQRRLIRRDVFSPIDDDDGARLAWAKRERCNAAEFHLAVCDPLSRRYVILPTIPEELATQPQDRLWEFEPVLAPATGDDGEEESFKVICMARYVTKLVLFVFPSTTMQWCIVESPVSPSLREMSCFDCVRGCFYWTEPCKWSDHLMVLDTRTLTFSAVDLLTGYHEELSHLSFGLYRLNAVVAGREGTLDMFSLVCPHGSFALYHTSLQNNSQEWKLEKIIHLSGQYNEYSISTVAAAEGFLFFRGTPEGIPVKNSDCYSMEVKTYEITKVCCKMANYFGRMRALPYFSFLPVLSEPTV